MSSAAVTADAPGAIEADGKQEGSKGGKKKLLLMAAPVLLLLAGGGLWFTGVAPKLLGFRGSAAQADGHGMAASPAPIFFEIPEIVANLNGNPRRPSYIKLRPRLELSRPGDAAPAQAAMPRLLDMFQTFLHETRPEELRGSGGIERLREELLARANLAAAPAKVVDVLFVEMLIQ